MERNELVHELSRATFSLVIEGQRGMSKAFDAPRVGVLRVVLTEGPVRPSAISERLDMAPSSVTRHVQALEDAGHLAVRPDPDDARTCLIEVTGEGRTELEHLESIGRSTFARVVAEWADEDLRTLTGLLQRLTSDWERNGKSARRTTRPANAPRWRYRPTTSTEGHDDHTH